MSHAPHTLTTRPPTLEPPSTPNAKCSIVTPNAEWCTGTGLECARGRACASRCSPCNAVPEHQTLNAVPEHPDRPRVCASRGWCKPMASSRKPRGTSPASGNASRCSDLMCVPCRPPGVVLPGRCRAKREQLERFQGLLPEGQGQKLALTVLFVPSSLDSGA